MMGFSNTTLFQKETIFWSPDYMEISSWIEHIPFAFWVVDVARPRVIVELGVHSGTSYFAFCQAIERLNLNTVAYGIDTWQGDKQSGFYGAEVYGKVAGYNTSKFSRFSTLIQSTFDEAKDYFTDGSIELLHIDGLHTYEAVKHDFETWLPKLAKNAIVIFHDINVRERDFGVFKFWDELKKQYPNFQFDFGYGLGVICIGKPEANELEILFNQDNTGDLYLFLRNLFAERGAFLKEKLYNSLELAQEKERFASLENNNTRVTENYKALETSVRQLEERYKNDINELSEKLTIADTERKSYFDQIMDLRKIIDWYKATYENRGLFGVIFEKFKQKKKTSDSILRIKEKKFSIKSTCDFSYDSTSNLYTSTGSNPFLIIDLENKQLPAGWYWVSIKITTTKEPLYLPKFYYDCGQGFSEGNIWNLNNIKNGKIEGLVNFPKNIVALRFTPSTYECSFQLTEISLKKLNKVKALSIAISQYKKTHFHNQSYVSFWANILASSIMRRKPGFRKKLQDSVYKKVSMSGKDAYKKWYKLFDTITATDIEVIKSLAANLEKKPLFSIIMPVYNAPIKYLQKAIESVKNQAYTKWELCIADDKSTSKAIQGLLKNYQKSDPRIKVVFREVNGHISNASNSALELATGDYIALLDQDDELRPHSLYAVAKAINDNYNLSLIYSDEDKIDENDNRFDPYFKTDWNLDLFYGQNLINHLGVYKHSLIKKIGGFRAGYEGSQDYDLALRCLEHIQPEQIHHIPHVLYHWRAIKGSTAASMSSKNYAVDAGIKALQDHFTRTNQKVTVLENVHHSYRVKWDLPEPHPQVSIIIPTKDKVEVLSTCVKSILEKTSYRNYEVLIVDNKSTDEATLAYLTDVQKNNKHVSVLSYDSEFNFSAIVNYGVKKSNGSVVVLLNNDTEVINKDWLTEMVSQCMREEIGAVGAKLFYPNGQIQHAGVFLFEGHPGNHIYLKRDQNDPGYFNKLNLVQNYSAVTAACLAIRKEVYLEAGGCDEENLKVAYNDVDLCLKIRELGYRNLFTPFAQLFHYESLSRGSDMSNANLARFLKEHSFMLTKWKNALSNDPFFNPNLAIETHTTQFAFPPAKKYEWKRRPNNTKNEGITDAYYI